MSSSKLPMKIIRRRPKTDDDAGSVAGRPRRPLRNQEKRGSTAQRAAAGTMSRAPGAVERPRSAVQARPQLRDKLRIVGAFGSNKVMAGELSRLVRRAYNDIRVPVPDKEGPGAVSYPFDARMAAVAVRYHRTSARVLWELYRSPAVRLEPLYEDIFRLVRDDPHRTLISGYGLSVSAFGVSAFGAGERQLVGTVKNAIINGAAERGVKLHLKPNNPELVIDVRMVDGCISVALDLAGRPMHKRGYRQVSSAAPLREDVAAQLLMLSRFDARKEMLIDPMAGSGTIGIEAACMAAARPNWCSGRKPLCDGWPALAGEFAQRAVPLFSDTTPSVFLSDVLPECEEIMKRNADTAGVLGSVNCTTSDLFDLNPAHLREKLRASGKESALLLSNPPYGERLGRDLVLTDLYRHLGRFCRQLHGFRIGFLVANPDFQSCFGLTPTLRKPVPNGPLEAVFYLYDLSR